MSVMTAKALENMSMRFNKHIFKISAAVFLITVLPRIIYTDYILTRKDTREIAYKWVKSNIPAKSKILRFPYTPEFKPSDKYNVKIDWHYKISSKKYSEYDYIITTNADVVEYSENKGYKLINKTSGRV
ncbi:unnamed protein product, partial [marine sediment metagenome]